MWTPKNTPRWDRCQSQNTFKTPKLNVHLTNLHLSYLTQRPRPRTTLGDCILQTLSCAVKTKINNTVTLAGYRGKSHLVLCGVCINGCNELVVDVESVSLFQTVSSDCRSAVALRCLPDHRHVVFPDILHVQVGWFWRLLCNSHSLAM